MKRFFLVIACLILAALVSGQGSNINELWQRADLGDAEAQLDLVFYYNAEGCSL